MKTHELIEDRKYKIDNQDYLYRGKDGGGKFVFVKCYGHGLKVYHKNSIEVPALPINDN